MGNELSQAVGLSESIPTPYHPGVDTAVTHAFILRKSPQDPDITFLHSPNFPPGSPPLYSVSAKLGSNPDMIIYHGPPAPNAAIGIGTSPSKFSSGLQINLRGRAAASIKKSQLTGDFTVECTPPLGRMKWKVDKILGMSSSMDLVDAQGIKVARVKTAPGGGFSLSGGREKVLEVLVPCDEYFLELVVLTGVAAGALKQQSDKVEGEVIQAVVGV